MTEQLKLTVETFYSFGRGYCETKKLFVLGIL